MRSAAQEWERCRHWIEAALETAPGLETIEDVERSIESGGYVFFSGPSCAVVCEVREYKKKRVFWIVHGGGNLGQLLDEMEPVLCDYARACGCDLIMGGGREGWKKPCEKRGYRFGWLVMVKDLNN